MSEQTPILGLVLAGGRSRRMGRDKATLVYPGRTLPQWLVMAQLLQTACDRVALSLRSDQLLPGAESWTVLRDPEESQGPLTGLLTALSAYPDHACLAVACDLPHLDRATLGQLLAARGHARVTAFRSSHDGLPEPLCALYEPGFGEELLRRAGQGMRCPRKILIEAGAQVRLVDLAHPQALDNANTPEDFARITGDLAAEVHIIRNSES